MRTVIVNGDALTVDDVVDVADGAARAELGPEVAERMEFSRAVVAEAIAGDRPVYGVNTGFGALADTAVGVADLNKLQRAIIVSHAAASGEPLDDRAVRAILLLRARTLAAGLSGVRADLPAPPAGAAGPQPAAGHPRQGLRRRVRRPGPARPPGPAADRRRAGCAAPATARAAARRRGAGRARHRAAGPGSQGGPVPGQRHRADAGPAGLLRARRGPAGSAPPTSPAPCRSRRCSAPTAPMTCGSRSSARTPASSTAPPTCAPCWPARA